MSNTTIKPVAAAVGFALVGSLAVANLANAADNPFGAAPMKSGYMQLAEAKQEGMSGMSGMSGDKAKKEGKCGEGKCGGEKKAGEGKCGGAKKPAEGKCGGGK